MRQWVLDGRKFLTDEEIVRLKKVCRPPACAGRSAAVRPAGEAGTEKEKLIINLGLLAGLRVKEIAGLKCGDISLGAGASSLIVRNGKGGKMRLVRFNGELKESFIRYLRFEYPPEAGLTARNSPDVHRGQTGSKKGGNNEAPNQEKFLFPSDKGAGHISRRTVQRVFERAAKRAGISGHSFHHLRHTYASYLYRAGNYNLRLVQKQLGHSSIKTTQVYADVFDEDLTRAVERLYKS